MNTCCFLSKGGPELDGIYVKSLLPGGAAEASGKIRNGGYLTKIFFLSSFLQFEHRNKDKFTF